MIPHISAAIVGGGVVGLNIAKELATIPAFKESVAVFERCSTLGAGQSGRNSGVIHAGIYYQPGSLKALLCVEGRERLKQYASLHDIPWAETGKLIVATEKEEESALEMLLSRSLANGLEEGKDISLITEKEARGLVPSLRCTAALHSKRTGIIDAASYIQALRRDALRQGVQVLLQQEIIDVRPTKNYVEFEVKIRQQKVETYRADYFVNASGLYADTLARMINPSFPHHIIPIRGEYCTYTITREELSVNNMNIYPTPATIDLGGRTKTVLGIHLTPTFSLGGEGVYIGKKVLVGPSARRVEHPEDFTSKRQEIDYFYDRVVRFFPALQKEDLRLGDLGIRAAVDGYDDFVFELDQKYPGCLQIVGTDSPFLTASAAGGGYARKVLGL